MINISALINYFFYLEGINMNSLSFSKREELYSLIKNIPDEDAQSAKDFLQFLASRKKGESINLNNNSKNRNKYLFELLDFAKNNKFKLNEPIPDREQRNAR
jgi:hypothetical protein